MAVCVGHAIGTVVIRSWNVHPSRGGRITNKPAVIDAGRVLVQSHPGLARREDARVRAEIAVVRRRARGMVRVPGIDRIHPAIHGHAADRGWAAFISIRVPGGLVIGRTFVHRQALDIRVKQGILDQNVIGRGGGAIPWIHRPHAPLVKRVVFSRTDSRDQ